MSAFIKTSIVRIGDQQAIYIPKHLFDFTHLETEVELEVKNRQIVIHAPVIETKDTATHPTRYEWDEQFKLMSMYGDDQILDDGLIENSWDEDEWEWM